MGLMVGLTDYRRRDSWRDAEQPDHREHRKLGGSVRLIADYSVAQTSYSLVQWKAMATWRLIEALDLKTLTYVT